MGKRKDRDLIFEAAECWRVEMVNYIIPGVQTKAERKGYERMAGKLDAALTRERLRAAAKRQAGQE